MWLAEVSKELGTFAVYHCIVFAAKTLSRFFRYCYIASLSCGNRFRFRRGSVGASFAIHGCEVTLRCRKLWVRMIRFHCLVHDSISKKVGNITQVIVPYCLVSLKISARQSTEKILIHTA
jgi:hypothetical protein